MVELKVTKLVRVGSSARRKHNGAEVGSKNRGHSEKKSSYLQKQISLVGGEESPLSRTLVKQQR